jgi:class 3 adenylate cyclase/tetratricopeptide (TPR) repeat protein
MTPDEAPTNQQSGAEYRLVTILFADVVGSTELTAQVEAEMARLIFDRCLRTMSQVIDEYGGTVARLMGDGLLAFFGAPTAHEDDPERAALAALQIHRSIQRYGAELNMPLAVRVGLNTGRVVMGEVGGEELAEYTAMGQPINLAARLQASAAPGSTLIGETTYRLISHLFEAEAQPPLQLKGFDQKVLAYRLVRLRERAESSRSIPGLESTLIDRDTEREKLSTLVSDLQAGRGAIAALIGEPGIGKSRLLHEIRKDAAELPLSWAEGRASSYTSEQPFSVIRDLLSELLDLNTRDTPAILDLKLERELAPLFGDRLAEIWPLLALLIGAPVPPAYADRLEGLEPDALNRGMTNAFCELAEAMAARQPMVLAFDDLHWADPSSLDLLRSLFLATERAPLLILLLFRPDRDSHIWELKAYAERDFGHRYTELTLEPLSEGQTHELVSHILANPELPTALLDFLREKSEGNPFFIEEFVQDLVESGALEQRGDAWQLVCDIEQVQLPETLQEVVQARIDRLPQAERLTLQSAAVIGRRFGIRLLEAVAPQHDDLSSMLLTLQRADLIRERTRLPEPVYGFRQSIVQEVIYHQLLSDQRQELHRRIATALEENFADRLDENASVIARHFELAGEIKKALHFHQSAGDQAFRLNANREAIDHFARALELAGNLPFDTDQIEHLFFSLGRAYELTADYDRALQTYQRLQSLAETHDEPHLALQARLAQTTLRVTPTPLFDPIGGKAEAEEALQLARDLKDPQAEAKMLWNLCLLGRFTGRDDEAITYGEESLAIAEAHQLEEQTAFTLTDLFWSYLAKDSTDKAGDAIRKAYEIWERLENLPMMTDCLSGQAFLHFLRGEFDHSIEASEEAWNLSERIDNLWGKSYSQLYVSLVYLEQGRIAAAFKAMHTSVELGRQAGFVVPGIVLPAIEALTYANLGQTEHALELVSKAFPEQYADLTQPFVYQIKAQILALAGEVERAAPTLEKRAAKPHGIGTLHLILPLDFTRTVLADACNQPERVLELTESLHQYLEQRDIHSMEPMIDYFHARALMQLGRTKDALEYANHGLECAMAAGARWSTWQLFSVRSRLLQEQGDDQAAREDLLSAVKLIHYIAEHADDPDLSAAFLSRPEVSTIIAQANGDHP